MIKCVIPSCENEGTIDTDTEFGRVYMCDVHFAQYEDFTHDS